VFSGYLLSPRVFYLFPIVEYSEKGIGYNLLFSVIFENWYVVRNYGIFWEPGAFAVHLCLAIFFELFYFKLNIKRVIILTICVLTTLSTLGFVCLGLLFIIYITINNTINLRLIKYFFVFSIIVALLLFFVDVDYVYFHVFGKIENYEQSDTTQSRINACIYPLEAFLSSPICGIGLEKFLLLNEEKCGNVATFTFLNCLTLFGLFWGMTIIIGCINFFTSKVLLLLPKLMLTLFTILLFFSEAFEQLPLLYILALYGFQSKFELMEND